MIPIKSKLFSKTSKNANGKIDRNASQRLALRLLNENCRPIILFGTGTIAEVILFYYNKLSNQSIELCCVDRNMRNKASGKI